LRQRLGDRRAALDPIAAIQVLDASDSAMRGVVDVATDDAVYAATSGLCDQGVLEFADEIDGGLDLELQECRERPQPKPEVAPSPSQG